MGDDELIPAHEAVEALRDAVGTLKLILENDEACAVLETIMLDEEVTLLSCVTVSLQSIVSNELLKELL